MPGTSDSRDPGRWRDSRCGALVVAARAQRMVQARMPLTRPAVHGESRSRARSAAAARVRSSRFIQPRYIESRHRPMEPFERELTDAVSFDDLFDAAEYALRNERLTSFCLCAQTRSEAAHRADGAVIETPFETNRTQRGIALRDADADAQVVTAFFPLVGELREFRLHLEGHPDRLLRRIVERHRIVEEDHDRIAREAFDRALVRSDEAAHDAVVVAEHTHHFFGIGRFAELGVAMQVDEHNGDFGAMAAQRILGLSGENQLGDLRREKTLHA